MTTTCKLCGEQGLNWLNRNGGWRLMGAAGLHRCPQYEKGEMVPPKKQKTGAYLRMHGPRGAPTHAVLVETRVPHPDTPAGLYMEPTKSPIEHCLEVRGIAS